MWFSTRSLTVTSDMRLQPNIGSDRSWVWKVAADVSEGTPTAETLAIRFANSDSMFAFRYVRKRHVLYNIMHVTDAGQFKVAFEAGQRTNADIVSQALAQPTPDAAAGVTEPEVAPQPTPAEAPTQDTETKVEQTPLVSSEETKGAEKPLAGDEAKKETAETSETTPEGAATEPTAAETQLVNDE
jgi:Ran-binding protein 1